MMFSLGTIGKNTRRILILAAILHAANAAANCSPMSGNTEATPDVNLTDNGNGTVTHGPTGLIWKKCVEGYTDNNCTTGAATTYTWRDALQRSTLTFASQTDWRVPNRNELLSLVETACSSNTINTTRFPNSPPSATVWTSTPLGVGDPVSAWAVRFGDGRLESKDKSSQSYVRLVRSGAATNQTFSKAANLPTGGPNAFSFTANTTAIPSTLVTSNTVALTGITGSVPISITDGEYSISSAVTFTNATETVNRAAHGLAFGDTVQFSNSGGALPTGISAATNYYVTGKNSIGATITFTDTGDIVNWTGHGLTAGTAVVFTTTGTLPTSLTAGTTYYVRTSGLTANAFTVSTTGAGGTIRTFTGTGTGTHTIWTDKVLADSFSISASAGGIQALNFTTDGTGTNYLAGQTWATSGTVGNNDALQARLLSAPTGGTTKVATVNVNGRTAGFSVTTLAPSPIAFTSQSGVPISSVVTSDAPTLSGITGSVNITALSGTGGSLAVLKNGTSYTAANLPLAVSNGDTIALRQTTSGSASTATTAIVTINGQSFTFTATTGAGGGAEPADFSFTLQNNVARGANITSDTVQVTGLTTARDVTISGTGASYRIGRQVTFSNASDLVNWTGHGLPVGTQLRFVNIAGGLPTGLATGTDYYVISANLTGNAFQVSTSAGGAAVNFTSDGTGSHFAEVNGVPVTITNGSDLINWTAHGLPVDTIVEFKVLPGGTLPGAINANTPYYIIASGLVANGFKVSTTRGGTLLNITSDGSGVYAQRIGATFTTVDATANTITTTTAHGFTSGEPVMFRGSTLPTGVNTTTVYTISPNSLSSTVFKVQSGGSDVDFTATGSGTRYIERVMGIMNNNSLTVSGTSSTSISTQSTVTATINSRSFDFNFTTGVEPTDFYFEETYGAALNQTTCTTNANCASGTSTLGGIASGSSNTISVSYSTSGAVSINGGAWAASPTSFTSNGADTIAVRLQTPNCNYSPVWADVTINDITSRFMAWTGGGLTGPAAIAFTALTNQAKNALIQSNQQTVSGLGVTPTCIRVENGEYQIGAGAWTSNPGTIANTNLIRVRHTSSPMPNMLTRTTLFINGEPFVFDVTTGP